MVNAWSVSPKPCQICERDFKNTAKGSRFSGGYHDNERIKERITRLSLCTFISWVSAARLWAVRQF
ncbi:hypothetical protein THOE12_80208 [Vibrio rotiferianus]|nr:hypothetical protein THOE12_80208 [Vibrio rotiferianus]